MRSTPSRSTCGYHFLKPTESIDALALDNTTLLECTRLLTRSFRALGAIPQSYTLNAHPMISSHPVASGPTADIYRGILEGREVCVKRIRVYPHEGPWEAREVRHTFLPFPLTVPQGTPKFFQEAIIWKRMKHPSIVPFHGATVTPPQLVSEWMPNGDITEYQKNHPQADRLGLVCPPLLLHVKSSPPSQILDIAEGLNYLHSNGVVHGDLKGVREFRGHCSNALTGILAECSHRQYRQSASHGLWPLHRRRPGTYCTDSRWLFHKVDRTGDIGRGNWCQQANRHVFIWDGRDRGMNLGHYPPRSCHLSVQGFQRGCPIRRFHTYLSDGEGFIGGTTEATEGPRFNQFIMGPDTALLGKGPPTAPRYYGGYLRLPEGQSRSATTSRGCR